MFVIIICEEVHLYIEYINEMMAPFVFSIVVMDDEDGRCLLDVIW